MYNLAPKHTPMSHKHKGGGKGGAGTSIKSGARPSNATHASNAVPVQREALLKSKVETSAILLAIERTTNRETRAVTPRALALPFPLHTGNVCLPPH